MYKMIKLIMLLLALAMMLSLASCGGSADGEKKATASTQALHLLHRIITMKSSPIFVL